MTAPSAAGPSGQQTRRVGIVTINDDRNFGNRLQNYALQEVLRSLGWEPETVRNRPPKMERRLLASRALHALVADGPVEFARRNGRLLLNKLTSRGQPDRLPHFTNVRRDRIREFAEDYLRSSAELYDAHEAAQWDARYAKVLVGSDQVWNHGFRNAHGIDFLAFAREDKRIAYAASFGVHSVPKFLKKRYATWLSGIPHISVREQRAAEIVAELTDRDVPVVLDPTLLLSRSDWSRIEDVPLGRRGPYGIRFFLGRATTEQTVRVEAEAASRGLTLVDLNDLDDEEIANLGPRQFIGALGQAEFVATDSFHAAVFAILYDRPLIIRSRDETDSRLHTLLALHGLQLADTGIAGLGVVRSPDWARAATRRREARAASLAFLREALGEPRPPADTD